jgi:hypothetical protein
MDQTSEILYEKRQRPCKQMAVSEGSCHQWYMYETIIRLSTSFGKMTKLMYEAGMAQRATFHLTAVTREGCTKCIMIHSSKVHLELMEIRYH